MAIESIDEMTINSNDQFVAVTTSPTRSVICRDCPATEAMFLCIWLLLMLSRLCYMYLCSRKVRQLTGREDRQDVRFGVEDVFVQGNMGSLVKEEIKVF